MENKVLDRKVLITKVLKVGPSRAVGSAFGFGSWTIGNTTIEVVVDPPIDLTTEEGKDFYKKLKDSLTKMCYKALQEDIEYARKSDKELDKSLIKREMLVNNSIKGEEDNGE